LNQTETAEATAAKIAIATSMMDSILAEFKFSNRFARNRPRNN
jgi:hypothetical protein